MDAEAVQIDVDRNNLIFTLLIVATLMMLCSFLFAFFVLDNFKNVPCGIRRGVGPPGKNGAKGIPGVNSTVTGAPGLPPIAPSVFRGQTGDPGDEIPGPTGRQTTSDFGTGFPGPVGPTSDTGAPGFDGLVDPGIIFSGTDQSLLAFYSDTELVVDGKAPTFTTASVKVPVNIIRMGAIVTLNIYPFLIFRQIDKVGLQGTIQLDLFTAALPLKEFSPPRTMYFPVIISKFTVTESNATTEIKEATQTNVDWGGILQITPNVGCTLWGYWSVYNRDDLTDLVPDINRLFFKSADSPFGAEGIISVSWLIDP